MSFNFAYQHLLLAEVDAIDGFHQIEKKLVLAAQRDDGTHVFRKTTAAVARTGKQKLEADAVIVPHAATNVVDVSTESIAKIGHLVDEADLGREHGVRGVLSH